MHAVPLTLPQRQLTIAPDTEAPSVGKRRARVSVSPMTIELPVSCSQSPIVRDVNRPAELPLSRDELSELLRAVLEEGGSLRLQVAGYSMVPFLQDGDLVTVAPLPYRDPRLGDVVAFLHPQHGKLTIHRVGPRHGDVWLVRGDATPESEALVPRTHIVGRVTVASRAGRRVRLGFGPERVLIALLSRWGLLRLVWHMSRALGFH